MSLRLISGKTEPDLGPTLDFASAAESGNVTQHLWEAQQLISELKSQLQDLRRTLVGYGPVWYDEDQDARLASSLALLDLMVPAAAAEHRRPSRQAL